MCRDPIIVSGLFNVDCCQADGREHQFLQVLDSLISDDSAEAGTGGESNQNEDPPTDTPCGLLRPSGRTIRPTWKVIESRLEPPTVHIETSPNPNRRVVLLVRESFHGTQNAFGLARTYKGVASDNKFLVRDRGKLRRLCRST